MSKTTITKVDYNKDVLSLLNDLCAINESVIIKKEEKKLLIQRTNNAKSVAYRLIMEPNSFNFDGDTVAFYKFPEFFQLLSCFDTPELHQSNEKLIISKDKSKINYLVSDAETLMKGPSKIRFDNPESTFELTTSDMKELKKMIGILAAKNTKISCSSSAVNITLYNNNHDNSFSKGYSAKSSEEFEYSISSDIFTLIPEGDYIVEVIKAGIVRFTLKRENISLEVFTAQIDGE